LQGTRFASTVPNAARTLRGAPSDLARPQKSGAHNIEEALMSEEKTSRPENQRIDVNKEQELTYWSREFGVTRDRLREAVEIAGPIAQNVEKQLHAARFD
jgi:hypothetical protein